MPSGHAQTSGLLGTILTCYVLDLRAAQEPETVSMAAVRVNAAMSAQTVCAIAYVWMLGIFGFPKGSKYQYSWWLGLVAACTVLALATAGAYLAES
eukprot:s9059_g1.t1